MRHIVINIEKLCDTTIIINDKADHKISKQTIEETLIKVIKQALQDYDNPK